MFGKHAPGCPCIKYDLIRGQSKLQHFSVRWFPMQFSLLNAGSAKTLQYKAFDLKKILTSLSGRQGCVVRQLRDCSVICIRISILAQAKKLNFFGGKCTCSDMLPSPRLIFSIPSGTVNRILLNAGLIKRAQRLVI